MNLCRNVKPIALHAKLSRSSGVRWFPPRKYLNTFTWEGKYGAKKHWRLTPVKQWCTTNCSLYDRHYKRWAVFTLQKLDAPHSLNCAPWPYISHHTGDVRLTLYSTTVLFGGKLTTVCRLVMYNLCQSY